MDRSRVTIDGIRDARARASGVVKLTPMDLSATFSHLCGKEIHLKMENLQKTGSFKVRGALNKIQQLGEEARARGVITASAGNHAQGVAFAARIGGVRATVVMPETAAVGKTQATAGYGAEVVLAGRDYSEAYTKAIALACETKATFIPAFDDAEVICGQGTVGLELLEQLPDVDAVVVPVGGGGLLAGMITALRESGSHARIIAVQVAGTSGLAASMRAGSRVTLQAADTIADGLATGSVGALPFEIIRQTLDQFEEVSDAQTAAAVLLLLERAKTVVEGAGAVGLAACLAGRLSASVRKVAVILSGGNIDPNLLDRILNLGLLQEGRLMRVGTRLPDRPGSLQRLIDCVSACRANIHQIHHARARPGLALMQASVTLDLETRGAAHIAEIERALREAGFELDHPLENEP